MKVTGIGKETTNVIRESISDLIHPWQYKNSDIHIVNVDSVLSDVETNWNQEIRFRQGFKINDDKSLNIPTMFVQINGIYEDKKDYKNLIEKMNTKNTYRINTKNTLFEINDGANKQAQEYNILYMEDQYEVETFKKMHTSVQKMMNKKLLEFMNEYCILPTNLLIETLSKIFSLNSEILNLLQNFDYPFKNPKILVEDMEGNNFSDADKYVLIFLYGLGFDIIIFSPKGKEFLHNYPINTITLDKYLLTNEKSYDYRDDKEIAQEKKQQEKEEKKRKREREKYVRRQKIADFCITFLVVAFVVACVAGFFGAIYYSTLPTDMEVETNNINFKTFSVKMYSNTDNVNVYKFANTESEVIETVVEGTEFDVMGESDNWYKVNKNGNFYYVKTDSLREKLYDVEIKNFKLKMTSASSVDAHKYPNSDSEVLFSYDEDDSVYAIGYTNDWYMVEKNENIGFINRKEFLTKTDVSIDDKVKNEKPTNTETETSTEENTTEDETAIENTGEVVESNSEVTFIDICLIALVIFLILFLIAMIVAILE